MAKPYYLYGYKDPSTEVKDMEPFVLSDEEKEVLGSINLTDLFDTYDYLAVGEYPTGDKLITRTDMHEGNITALDYINNKIDANELVLYKGDLLNMSAITTHRSSEAVQDTIFLDPNEGRYNNMYLLVHELAHTEKLGDDYFLHNITKEGSKGFKNANEREKAWEELENLTNKEQ